MRREQFDIVLRRQEEQRPGQLLLQMDADGVSGYVTLSGHQTSFRGKLLRKNHYIISLRLQTESTVEDCDALLLAKDDGTLTGVLLSPWQTWTLLGARTAGDAACAL